MPKRLEDIAWERCENIIDKEIALANSAWAISNGYRLLQLGDSWDFPEPKDEPKR